MDEDTERLFYLGVGPLAAVVLGVALVPLRDLTVASNFTFAFLILIIGVAELGGRGPALATALASTLSLDFFLTEPYLRLTIAGKHDIIAFVGLGACGLVAAVLGAQRRHRTAALGAARNRIALLETGLDQLESAQPIDERMAEVLDALVAACPVSAAVVRDERDHVVGASARGHALPVPLQLLPPHGLLPPTQAALRERWRKVAIPREGRRIAVLAAHRQVGWLDVWGTGQTADSRAAGALADAARLSGLLLAGAFAADLPLARRNAE